MALIQYEWRKLWKNASFLKIFLFLLSLSAIIFWGELQEHKEWIPIYLNMHQTDEISDMLENDERSREEDAALEEIVKEKETLEYYETYRESIQNRYEENQMISVFSDSVRNPKAYMKQIADTYAKLKVKAPMKFQPYMGVRILLDSYAGDLLSVVFLLYLVSVVFIQESKNGKSEFTRTMIYGKTRLEAAKIITVYGSMVLYTVLTFAIRFLLQMIVFGAISYSAAIQSVPDFFTVPYAWTIGQYLAVCLMLKLVAVGVLTVIAAALAKYSESVLVSAVGIILLFGNSIAAAEQIQGNHVEAILRFWNIWTFLRGKDIVGSYELIRAGNFIIEVRWGIFVLIAVIFGVFFLTLKKERRERMKKEKKARKKLRKPHHIFYYEAKKMWLHQGGIVCLAACILMQGMTVWNYQNYLGTDEYYYQKYIDRFGEWITEETDDNIRKEEQRLQGMEEELEKETSSMKIGLLMRELECRGGFQRYKERVENLQAEEGKEPILLKDTQYKMLFGFTEVSRMMIMLLCASFAFLIPPVFQMEKETNVEILQKTSQHGGKLLWQAKIRAILLYTISFVSLCAVCSFWKVTKTYSLQLHAPIDCLLQYWTSPVKWSVIAVFCIGVLGQLLIASMAAVLLSACAKRVKNQYVMTGIILGGSVIPILLSTKLPLGFLRGVHDFFYVFTWEKRIGALGAYGCLLLAVLWINRREEKK